MRGRCRAFEDAPSMKILILAVAAAMYALVIAFPHRKAAFALAAAALVLTAGQVFPGPWTVGLGRAFGELVNWNILAIYIGSLVIADLFIYSRVPAVLADRIIQRSPTLGLGIVALLAITGILSAFVENVATVLLMAPIALAICGRLKVEPAPFLIGLAVMANLQGMATLVGDPPSMIFASYTDFGFNDFFVHRGRPSLFFVTQVGALVGAVYFFFYFRKLGKVNMTLPIERIVSWIPSLLLLGMISGLAVISFASGEGLHAASGLLCLALGTAGLFWFVLIRKEPASRAWDLVRHLDWETILFLVGIFILVGAIGDAGILEDLSAILGAAIAGRALLGFAVIVAVSSVSSRGSRAYAFAVS